MLNVALSRIFRPLGIIGSLSMMLAASCVATANATLAPSALGTLRQVAEVVLPGAAGRFDYQTVDAARGWLLIDQMGAGRVLVFDLRREKLDGVVPGLGSPTGITLAAGLDTAFVSDPGNSLNRAWGEGSISVIDLKSLRIVRRLPADGFPDGSAWVPGLQRLYVSNERGGVETVVDGRSLRVLDHIALGGEAGNSAYDAASDRVLVNVQTRGQIAVIDPQHNAVVQRVDLPDTCQHNHGLLLDPGDGLAFVACDGNARLLTLSLRALRPLAVNTLGRDPDVLALDPARHLLWVASESGVLSLFAVAPSGVTPLWQGKVGGDAHSVAVDPRTGWAWFPLEDLHGHPALRALQWVAAPSR